MRWRDYPRSVDVSYIVTPDVVLTNVVWNPDPDFSGQPETGVRLDGKFHLIQHGWWQWGMATVVILNRLRRGWDTERIGRFMDWCRERRRWPYPVIRARRS